MIQVVVRALCAAPAVLFPVLVASLVSACGGGGGATDSGSTPIPPPSTQPTRLELVAGSLGGSGNVDGPGNVARFRNPNAVASDAFGNLYVADTNNHEIRKIDANNVVSTLAGSSQSSANVDGTGAAARFFFPSGIATDSAGNVYVTDPGNKNVRKVTPAGVVTTLAGSGITGIADGAGPAAQFSNPVGPAVDASGNVFVIDGGAIRKITPAGVVSTFAGAPRDFGIADGNGAEARFSAPAGLAIDGLGRIYVADGHLVRVITPSGSVSTLAGNIATSGSTDGVGSAASFDILAAITVDAAGTAYVIELANAVPGIRRITPDGSVTTVARSLDFGVISLAVRNGVLVAANSRSIVEAIGFDGSVTTIAGSLDVASPAADGTGAAAGLGFIGAIAADPGGNLFVAESFAPRLRRMTRDATVTTLIADNATNDPFSGRSSVATDRNGNVYFGTTNCIPAGRGSLGSCTGLIRKIAPTGQVSNVTSTVNTAQVVPSAIAVDAAGSLYVADGFNCAILKITPDGNTSALAGPNRPFQCHNGQAADGVAATAGFESPQGIAVDAAGTVYVADAQSHTIRRITPEGVVTTLAGMSDTPGDADGAGSAARFNGPTGIVVDGNGILYVADSGNSLIRKVSASGVVTTIVGTSGIVGFVPGPLPGVLATPTGAAVVGSDLFIAMPGGIAVAHDRP